MNGKKVMQKWSFNSTSNPNQKPYEVLQYADGSLSCNCPSWVRGKKQWTNGVRQCKHTRGVQAMAMVQIGEAQLPSSVTMPPAAIADTTKLAQATLSLHKRKLRL
jgi:hypothetical protein